MTYYKQESDLAVFNDTESGYGATELNRWK